MSSLKDLASLIMIPSLYKDGELHTVKPLADENIIVHPDATDNNDGVDGTTTPSTSSNFTFSRGSNLAATRVDVNGLIEKGRENILPYSNQFDTTWSSINASETSGQSGYDGTNNAWAFTDNTATNIHALAQYGKWTSSVCTGSIYVKAGSLSKFYVSNGTSGIGAFFNLSTGSVEGVIGAVIDKSITSVGGGWYRLSVTMQSAGTFLIGTYETFVSGQYNSTINYTGTSSNIYIQDAQLEQGLVATDYIETGASTAQAGILEDMPRLDYSGSCPSLLLEPQRSNYATQSEYIGGWIQSDITGVDNFAVSPEGVQNASKVSASLTPLIHFIQLAGGSVGNTATISLFAKADTGSYIQLTNPYSGAIFANFDVATGVVGTKGSSCISSDIEDYGNGWYRCIAVFDNTGFPSNIYRHYMVPSASALFGQSWLPTSDTSLFIYGHSWESGSYPTSYIPTYGSSVTRSQDVCEDAGDADTFNDSQGVLFLELKTDWEDINGVKAISAQANINNYVSIYFRDNNFMSARINGGGSITQLDFTYNTNTYYKVALVYNATSSKLFVNGVLQDSDTTLALPTGLNQLAFNRASATTEMEGNVKQVLYFSTALTDSECIALTTL